MKLLLGLAVATFTRVALAVPLQRPFSYHLLAPQPDTQMMLWDGEVWNTAPDCNLTPGNAPAGTTCIATMTLTETIDPQDEDAGWMYYMMIMSKPDEGGSPVRVVSHNLHCSYEFSLAL